LRLELACADVDLFAMEGVPHIWVPRSEKWLCDARDAARLLAFYNTVRERGGTCLFTGQPSAYDGVLPDLTSRLKALPTVSMGIPDDTVFEQTLVHLFEQAQVPLVEGAVDFLAKQTRRTFRDAQKTVAWLASESLRCQKKISVPFLKKKLIPSKDGL
jgi:DnaA family protein